MIKFIGSRKARPAAAGGGRVIESSDEWSKASEVAVTSSYRLPQIDFFRPE